MLGGLEKQVNARAGVRYPRPLKMKSLPMSVLTGIKSRPRDIPERPDLRLGSPRTLAASADSDLKAPALSDDCFDANNANYALDSRPGEPLI